MEMPKDINTFDSEDIGLKAIFGDRFHDQTEQNPGAVMKKPTAKKNPAKAVKAPAIEPKTEPNTAKDAQWIPVKPDPNWLDRLKSCVKWVGLFAGLCALVFYWQQTGQMTASAAVPSMCVCCGLAGVGVGKNVIRGNR